MALVTTPEAREKRFWALVRVSGEGDCWLWSGAKCDRGYGNVRWGPRGKTKQLKAHRLSFEYANGKIPDDLCVLHKCDTPLCVNPAHLFLGTRADNNADKVAKGRQPHHRGETNPRAKLTKEDALDITKMLNAGVSQAEIARMFGVHQTQISRVKRGYLVDA
jgi:hypothetical protein